MRTLREHITRAISGVRSGRFYVFGSSSSLGGTSLIKRAQERVYAHRVPSDDELSQIQFLNESEERTRSPVSQYSKEVISLIGEFVPLLGQFLGGINGALDRRAASNRAELLSALMKRVQDHTTTLKQLVAESEDHLRFFREEFPGLVEEAARRAQIVRSQDRVRRFASILIHALEVGPRDGADFVEEMLRIATELSDQDVKILGLALRAFDDHKARMPSSDSVVAANAWLDMKSGVSHDELESTGAKLQSFGLASRVQRQTGERNTYRVLERGRRFVDYILGAI
jgi:hypothetical protein